MTGESHLKALPTARHRRCGELQNHAPWTLLGCGAALLGENEDLADLPKAGVGGMSAKTPSGAKDLRK